MLVLICSHHNERQVAYVSEKIKQQGGTPIIFERYRKDHFVTIHYTRHEPFAYLSINRKKYALNTTTFPTVWMWMKPKIQAEIPGENASLAEKFCSYEWRNVIHIMDIFLQHSKWVNPIIASQRASYKINQLRVAREMGLLVPETVITNDSSSVKDIFRKHRFIYKTLSSFYTSEEAIYTNEISLKSLLNNRNAVAMAPGIYQQLIAKDHELRVTVIGDKVFVARINSQKDKRTSLDWRHFPLEDMYEEGKLSPETTKKLLSFHKKMGLVYGAYDFIVNKDGEEIFLECNPSGQSLWLERRANLSMADVFAAELLTNREGTLQ